jgi:ubiquinone/menaquinone biosynthesis C-methylase UbiE
MQKSYDPHEVAKFEHTVWSRCAKGYFQGFGVLVAEAIKPLLNAAAVAAGSRVLDVGTGPGLVAAAVRERGGTAIGIDFSDAMLSVARQTYPDIEFREADAESLPFNDGEFDAVVSNFVVHHLGQPQKALAEARRVLRDGGKIAFTVWADLSKLAAFGLFFAAVAEHANPEELPYGPLFGISDFDVFHGMVRGVGFRESSVTELDMAWKLPSIKPLLDAFRDWAQMDALSESVGAAIERTVREKAKAYESGGILTIPNPAILVSAVK